MFPKFEGIDSDKKDAIFNAALSEFARKGYKQASTNQIVKDAGISKGLLFHYFNSKKDLYLYLYDHFVQVFLEHILAHVNWKEKDIFLRNRQIAYLKLGLFQKYPQVFQFLTTVFQELDTEVKAELDERSRKFMSNEYMQMVHDIDAAKFKDGVDVKRAVQIIAWSLEGFALQQQEKLRGQKLVPAQIEGFLEEMDAYIEVLKQGFYKS